MSLSWIIIKSNNGEIITHNKFRSKLREKKLRIYIYMSYLLVNVVTTLTKR